MANAKSSVPPNPNYKSISVLMKYIELIYCKLVWFNTKTYLDLFSTKFEFYKWPTWSILYDARMFFVYAVPIIMIIAKAQSGAPINIRAS